jgi:hypothetical protein
VGDGLLLPQGLGEAGGLNHLPMKICMLCLVPTFAPVELNTAGAGMDVLVVSSGCMFIDLLVTSCGHSKWLGFLGVEKMARRAEKSLALVRPGQSDSAGTTYALSCLYRVRFSFFSTMA